LKTLARHLLVEMYFCDASRLDDVGYLERELVAAARESGATVIDSRFHKFSPQGVSGVVIIAESHFSIHSWPEYGYAALDFFTCGDRVDPRDAVDRIARRLGAKQVMVVECSRGNLPACVTPEAHTPDVQETPLLQSVER